MTAYIVIAALLVVVAMFLLVLEIGDRRHEPDVLEPEEAAEHLYPLGNVEVLERQNGSG